MNGKVGFAGSAFLKPSLENRVVDDLITSFYIKLAQRCGFLGFNRFDASNLSPTDELFLNTEIEFAIIDV